MRKFNKKLTMNMVQPLRSTINRLNNILKSKNAKIKSLQQENKDKQHRIDILQRDLNNLQDGKK